MKRAILIIILNLLHAAYMVGQPAFGGGDLTTHLTTNTPMNSATGAVSVNIPLWTASSGNLSASIGINYSSNGLRYGELPTEIGLGWNLYAGGSVKRIQRGRWGDGSVAANHVFTPADIQQFFSDRWTDYEPDYFVASAPGLSVTFFYDAVSNTYKPITNTNIIIYLYDGSTWEWTIISENGTVYKFSSYNLDKYDPSPGDYDESYGEEWLLNTIQSSDYLHTISFNYTPTTANMGPSNVAEAYDCNITENLSSITHTAEKHLLNSITTENEIVNFVYTTYSNEQVLNTLSITDKEANQIKQYVFGYNNLTNPAHGIVLTTLTEYGQNSTAVNIPYRFDYYTYSGSEPCFSFYCQDFWGYYGNNNNEATYIDMTSYTNRFPDPVKLELTKHGILHRVHYPQGGYTEYEYERNTYLFPTSETDNRYDVNWNTVLNENGYTVKNNLLGPGLRLKSVTDKSAAGSQFNKTEFDYTTDYLGNSSGMLTSYPRLQYTCNGLETKMSNSAGLEQGYVTYSKITAYNGGRFEQTNNGRNGKVVTYYSTESPSESNTTYAQPYLFPYQIKTYVKEFNGLLLKSEVYNKAGKKLSETLHDYETSQIDDRYVCGAQLVATECPSYTPPNLQEHFPYQATWAFYNIYANSTKLNYTTSTSYDDSLTPKGISQTITYTYNEYNQVATQTATQSDGTLVQTRFSYAADCKELYDVCMSMYERNNFNVLIKKEVWHKLSGATVYERIAGEYTEYQVLPGNYQPDERAPIVPKTQQLLENGTYKIVNTFNSYTYKGHLRTSTGIDGVPKTLIYNADETQIIATVINAAADEVFHTSFEDETGSVPDGIPARTGKKVFTNAYTVTAPATAGTYLCTYWKYDNNTWTYDSEPLNQGQTLTLTGTIDEIRVYPTDAYMTTVTYTPLVGVNSATDANDYTAYTEYDTYGRPSAVRDHNRKLIAETEYRQGIRFTIQGANDLPIGCTTTLTVQSDTPYEPFSCIWYKDACNTDTGSELILRTG